MAKTFIILLGLALIIGGLKQAFYDPYLMNRGYISKGFLYAGTTKSRVTDHYQNNGKFPSSNAEAWAPAPEEHANHIIKSVTIEEQGVVKIVYTAITGIDNGRLFLIPRYEKELNMVKWDCETPDYEKIDLLDCIYRPR